MYRISKRIISVVMVAAMTLSVVPYNTNLGIIETVEAAQNALEYGDNFQINSSVIPDTVLLRAVKKIVGGSETATVTVKQLKEYNREIDLSGYTDIKDLAGLGFALNATSIDISKLQQVTYINDYEFKDCAFTEFKMAPNVTEIGTEAFGGCKKLQNIEFPDVLVKIGDKAFKDCYSLDGIVLPDGIQFIGGEAFINCSSLKEIVIPDGINAATENTDTEAEIGIGANVFSGCSALKNVTLGAGMTSIPTGFLFGARSLTKIEIPEKIASIRNSAFSGSGLTEIDLSKNTGISVIDVSVFSNCYYLEKVTLPTTITDIKQEAFFGCVSLENAGFLESLENLVTIGKQAFTGLGAERLVIPANVEVIGELAFNQCGNLTQVSIRDFDLSRVTGTKVKVIGDSAFAECKSLEYIYLPSANETSSKVTTEIGAKAFSKCENLKDVYFPLNLTKIGDYAFEYCGSSTTDWTNGNTGRWSGKKWYTTADNVSSVSTGGKTEVTLYSTQIEGYSVPTKAYIDWTLCTDKYDDAHPITVIIANDSDGNEKMHTQYRTGIKEVNLSDNTNIELGIGIFQYCINLETVSLPRNLQVLPEKMFYMCATPLKAGSGADVKSIPAEAYSQWYCGLRTVSMSSVTTIGKSAFEGCYNLRLETGLPIRIKEIKDAAFRNCESIGALELPNTLAYIGSNAFANCSRNIGGFVDANFGLVKCDADGASKLEYIGSGAFSACPFSEFTLNASAPVTSIGSSAFQNCHHLLNITFSNNVDNIDTNALGLCFSLRTVTVPDTAVLNKNMCAGITKIGGIEFYTAYYNNGFALIVNKGNDNISVRHNGSKILPLYSIDSASSAYYSEIIVGEYKYTWDNEKQKFNEENASSSIQPEIVVEKVTVDATNYASESTKSIKAIKLNGIHETGEISLVVTGPIAFALNDQYKIDATVEVNYTAEVTGNPCTDISVDDAYYLSHKANSEITISPKFVPEFNDGEMTDVVQWNVDSGNELISITPSADGKSIKVKSLGASAGNARITVKAGAVQKSFYVYVMAPASGVTITPSNKVDLMIGESSQISATLKYAPAYAGMSVTNPDKVVFTSSNSAVVKVQNVVEQNGTTTCTIVAVGSGTATITATSVAGKVKSECKVNVSSANIKTTLTDKEGKVVGSSVSLTGKSKIEFNYAFNEELSLNGISYTIANPNIVKVTVNNSGKKVTIEALAVGTTSVTFYPTVGDAKNGVTINVKVSADVSAISLTKKTVEVGQTANVVSQIKNVFGDVYTPESGAEISSITDNTVIFTSSDPNVVSVDAKGNVKVLKVPATSSSVTITCTAMKGDAVIKSASTTVTPINPPAKDINATKSTTVAVGEVVEIPFAVTPGNGAYTSVTIATTTKKYDKILKYSWDKSKLILKVTAIGVGTVDFTLTVKNGSTVTCTKVIKVSVVKAKDKVNGKKPGKVKIKKAKAAKKKVTLTWKKVKGATGYQVQMSNKKKKGFKNIKKSTKKLKFVKKKLKSKKTYYFRVRAFVKNSSGKKVYGKWSKVKKAKVK